MQVADGRDSWDFIPCNLQYPSCIKIDAEVFVHLLFYFPPQLSMIFTALAMICFSSVVIFLQNSWKQ